MEGIFRGGEQAAEVIVNSVRSTFIGRTGGAIDRTVKTVFDTAFKRATGRCLEGRGYQLHGLNTPAKRVGLSRGQREVRFCSYRSESEPFLREARGIAASLLASGAKPATGLVLGTGECLLRVVIPEEIGSFEHVEDFVMRKEGCGQSGCMAAVLGCVGGKDLMVFDIRVSAQTRASVKTIADKCFGTNRTAPSYFLTQATSAVAAMMAKSSTGVIKPTSRSYIKFTSNEAEAQYLQSVQLILLAYVLNRFQCGCYTAAHIIETDNVDEMFDGDDTGDKSIWFPQNRGMNQAEDRLEQSIEALKTAQKTNVGLIPCLPATEFAGTPYEAMTVTISDDQHEELLKQSLKAEGGPTQHAFYCGPNITGAQPPLDTKSPESWGSAYTRHFCLVRKKIELPGDEILEVVHDKADAQSRMLTKHETRVWDDLINSHCDLFREWLTEPLQQAEIGMEGRPHSIDEETYNCVRTEVDWEKEFGARDILRAAIFAKSGENSTRARFITMPGVNQADALKHQCASSAITQILEKFHTSQFGFRNFKGCSLTGKAMKVARFIAHTSDKHVSIGYDKSANDATWNHRKWAKYEEYSMKMAKVLTDSYFDDNVGPLLQADAEHARKIEWRGLFLTVAATIAYFYLMSGVGPTSIGNRLGGDVSIGAGILQGYGEDMYAEWLHWCSGESAEIVEDADSLLFPHMNVGIAVKENLTTGFAHQNEGDDTVVRIVRREGETNSQAVAHFTKAIVDATREVWVPAYIDEKHLNSHGGVRSSVEVMSMIVAQVTSDTGECSFVHVPKPIKRLDKMAWTLSAALRVLDTPFGQVGVADSAYHRLNATRCLSMCTEMEYALFTRYVVYNTAKYHLNKLRNLKRVFGSDTPLYGDRTMEARKMPDAPGLIGDSIERAFESIGTVFSRTDVTTVECLEANANAWGLVNSAALRNGKALRDTLQQLDEVARGVDIEESHLLDPVSYLALFALGPLEVCFANSAGRLKDAVEKNDRNKGASVEELQVRLIECVSGGQNPSAIAQSQSGARGSGKGPDRRALGPGGKGGKAAGPHLTNH